MLRQAHAFLLSKRSSVIWPRSHLEFHAATSIQCPSLPVLQRQDRGWFALRPPDAGMSSRPLLPWVRGWRRGNGKGGVAVSMSRLVREEVVSRFFNRQLCIWVRARLIVSIAMGVSFMRPRTCRISASFGRSYKIGVGAWLQLASWHTLVESNVWNTSNICTRRSCAGSMLDCWRPRWRYNRSSVGERNVLTGVDNLA